jgi:hypothetical protein
LGGKFEAIVELEKYDTLTVNELFSKLKSAEVDRDMTAKVKRAWLGAMGDRPGSPSRVSMSEDSAQERHVLVCGDILGVLESCQV